MPTLKDYNDTDEHYNPSSQAARELVDREQGTGQSAGINAGIDQAEAFANDPKNATKNIDDAREKESNPFGYAPGQAPQSRRSSSRLKAVFGFARSRKGATTGILGGVSITGILISMMFSSFTSLVNLQSNALATNDSRSNILEKRLEKWIQKKTGNVDSACDVSLYKCRMGKMPNKMLNRMAEQGIVPLDAKGNEIKISSETGYADRNPSQYKIPHADGEKIISSADFAKEYKKNPILRASFKRVYSMRYRAWVGKTINRVFYNTFKLKQDGGIASDDKKLTMDTIDKELDARLESSTTKNVDASRTAFSDRFKSFIQDDIGKKVARSGDPILMAGGGYCLAVNAPRIAAGIYRAIQLTQILILANDVILSPAGKIKAGDARPEDASAIGSKLTEPVNGKSALDSPILQSAIGANRNKTAASKYAPGYSMYHSSLVQKSSSLSNASKGACSKITSPQAQIAVNTIEGAISVGSAGTGAILFGAMKAALKGAALLGAVDLALKAITSSPLFGEMVDQAFNAATKLAGNYTDGIRGEQLGDALGVGLFAYFSMSGLRGGSAVLKKDQIVAFDESMREVDNQYREEAVATLSPFDASSQYTFMGSLVSKLQLSGFGINKPIESLGTLGSLVLSAPSTLLSPTTAAAEATDVQAAKNRCDNNAMFDIEDDIGINPAGYPCVGIPAQYLDMSVDEVQSTVASDTDPDTGDWKPDGDIATRQAECGNADLTAIGGCTIENKTDAAESLYQYDKNVSDILDGTDDQPINTGSGSSDGAASTTTGDMSSAGDLAWPLDKKWWTSNKNDWLAPHLMSTGTAWGSDNMGTTDKGAGVAADIGIPPVGTPVYAMLGGTVTSTNLCGANDGVAIKSAVNGKTLGIAYMHGTNQKVKVGDTVQPGQQIESLGAAGCHVYGAHLHVGIAYNGSYVCPQLVFKAMDAGNPINWTDLASKSKAPCW